MIKRVGIYAGSFDPVHTGHVSFALQALEAAGLDEVYFVPERRPRSKPGVEHYGHRVAMINRALQPHPALDVLELHDLSLNIDRTLPKLEARFAGNQLVFLFGSDVVKHLQDWPHIQRLLSNCEIVVGVRSGDDQASLKQLISDWPIQPMTVTMFDSLRPMFHQAKSGRHYAVAVVPRACFRALPTTATTIGSTFRSASPINNCHHPRGS